MMGLMLTEYFYFKRKRRCVYDWSDTMVNFACGFGQVLMDSVFKVVILYLYIGGQEFLGITPLERSWAVFLTSFLFVDLSYYVYHRMSHTVNIMWAVHIAHHSSPHYNFSVALRQAWFHKLTAFPFYLVFLFLGIQAEVLALVIAAHALLQFFSHTQAIEKEIPFWGKIFVTPSFHRVHHGINAEYLNKNFAGIFSFWDRLFGTYRPERASVCFGVSPQLESASAWVANTHSLCEVFDQMKSIEGWGNKLKFSL